MYTYQTKIKLHETDAAGLLFFSNQFKLIHDAYESLLESIGFGFAELLRHQSYFLPIVHAESDYKAPLFVGDIINITVSVDNIGTTSFTFTYTITNNKNILVGTAKTVHVTIDKAKQMKIPLPSDMRRKIQELYNQDH
ncbi:MAG: acyl-CoA thioesterase [Candidatus Omnitrophica bacterium]|nr:acyl-CoA thioesterase [Candidatus Omnitrophota bacterium]